MRVLVAIACYKVVDLTIDCLRSLEPEVRRVPGTIVGVCENGSGGDAAERLQRAIDENGWGEWVDLLAIHPNRGFTGGTNAVIRKALAGAEPPEYVWLLNSDTLVERDSLVKLLEFMESHPRAGIAGSRLLSLEGETQASPFRFFNVASELDRGLRLGVVSRLLRPWTAAHFSLEEPCRADWICPASGLFRRAMFDEIGLLDEGLFTYFDDIDICMRARRAGWETWFVPGSRVVHLEGATTGVASHLAKPKRLPAYWHQARRRMWLRNYGPIQTALADAAFLSGFALWRLRRWLQRKPDTDPPHMLGDSWRHSVFRTGFRVTEVPNPAYASGTEAAGSAASALSQAGR
jgi:GT2 family glycosyltransferase